MTNEQHPLKDTALKVLEDWGMMLVDQVEPSTTLFELDNPLYMSWINLHGVVSGALSIVAQEGFMKTLANNLLGIEGEISQDEYRDAFKEMSNVLAGNFITAAYGEDTVFDLINPNVEIIDSKELEKFISRKIVFSFLADEHPVAVTFSLKEV